MARGQNRRLAKKRNDKKIKLINAIRFRIREIMQSAGYRNKLRRFNKLALSKQREKYYS